MREGAKCQRVWQEENDDVEEIEKSKCIQKKRP